MCSCDCCCSSPRTSRAQTYGRFQISLFKYLTLFENGQFPLTINTTNNETQIESNMSLHPEVLWAQRSNAKEAAKNIIYLTVRIPDSTGQKIDLTKTHLTIESDSQDDSNHYSLSIEFFDDIDAEKSTQYTTGNSIHFVLRKAEAREEYWPRLTKEKLKYHYIKTDFDKWRDEDEQEDEEPPVEAGMPAGFGGGENFDLSSLQGLEGLQGLDGLKGGLEGAGKGEVTAEDFSSSDEEENNATIEEVEEEIQAAR